MALKGEISNRRRIYCGAAEQIKMVLGHILRMMKIGLKNAQLVASGSGAKQTGRPRKLWKEVVDENLELKSVSISL